MNGLLRATGLSYNSAGQLTAANGMTLSWSPRGNLESVTKVPGVGAVICSYDFAGRRVSKIAGGVTTYYLYSGTALICALDGNGNVLKSYTWGPTGLVSDRVGTHRSESHQFVVSH